MEVASQRSTERQWSTVTAMHSSRLALINKLSTETNVQLTFQTNGGLNEPLRVRRSNESMHRQRRDQEAGGGLRIGPSCLGGSPPRSCFLNCATGLTIISRLVISGIVASAHGEQKTLLKSCSLSVSKVSSRRPGRSLVPMNVGTRRRRSR
jgi:hypothetical protein